MMIDEYANYMHALTGIVARLPRAHASLFPDLVEVDEEALCNTCVLPEPEEVEEVAAPVPVNTKTAKVFRSKEESND